jgi:hypothetical protein
MVNSEITENLVRWESLTQLPGGCFPLDVESVTTFSVQEVALVA